MSGSQKGIYTSSKSDAATSDQRIHVALLTGGADRPYAFGLAGSLINEVAALDVVGNDELDCSELRDLSGVRFFNLRGDQSPDADLYTKIIRVLKYYSRLICYSAAAKPKLFHILWNNKFEYFDRTLLMLWYRALGKKVVLTLHNVNLRRRDCKDTIINRATLRIQYRFADHIFVHTKKMKQELIKEFGEQDKRITVIPFGINNAVPNTELTSRDARKRMGILDREKTVLFFGNIAPYKGLEYLIAAFHQTAHQDCRLIIAGRPKNCENYWSAIRSEINDDVQKGRIVLKDEFIPDEDTEIYMKGADVLVLPYRHIDQSGVLFLGYSFGLPVLAADVGCLRDEIIEGRTGFVFRPEDPADLARVIDRYFASDLYADLSRRRREIRDYATEQHSWDIVAKLTTNIYSTLTNPEAGPTASNCDASNASPESNLS